MAAEQVGVGREKIEHLYEPASHETIAAAYTRALFEMDGFAEIVRGEDLARDLQ
jgi:hypothetical protein